jgi:hypothetical protein
MTDEILFASSVAEEAQVVDEAEEDAASPHPRYDITSYGSDPDVEGIVRRLRREEIAIPPFQRGYVWRLPEASKFIESLLLGLPVPGVFFAIEPPTNRWLVIDGQQRLKSLLFFYEGFFNPKVGEKRQRVFSLADVHRRFLGKTYATLEEPDRLRLDNSVIHATVVRQDSPQGEDTSIYHIFARLNSGGQKLAPQEIRSALYHGPLVDLVHDLNQYPTWRAIYGPPSSRLKDEELILRFLAFRFAAADYERPMSEFLNKFAGRRRYSDTDFLAQAHETFRLAVDVAFRALGKDAFRPERAINAAVLDSVLVGMSMAPNSCQDLSPEVVKERYLGLLADGAFQGVISKATADESAVKLRLQMAVEAFSQ